MQPTPDDRDLLVAEARDLLDELDADERCVAMRVLHVLLPDHFPPTDHISER